MDILYMRTQKILHGDRKRSANCFTTLILKLQAPQDKMILARYTLCPLSILGLEEPFLKTAVAVFN